MNSTHIADNSITAYKTAGRKGGPSPFQPDGTDFFAAPVGTSGRRTTLTRYGTEHVRRSAKIAGDPYEPASSSRPPSPTAAALLAAPIPTPLVGEVHDMKEGPWFPPRPSSPRNATPTSTSSLGRVPTTGSSRSARTATTTRPRPTAVAPRQAGLRHDAAGWTGGRYAGRSRGVENQSVARMLLTAVFTALAVTAAVVAVAVLVAPRVTG